MADEHLNQVTSLLGKSCSSGRMCRAERSGQNPMAALSLGALRRAAGLAAAVALLGGMLARWSGRWSRLASVLVS